MIDDFREEHFSQVKEIIYENFENPWSDSNIIFKTANSIKKVAILQNSVVIGFVDGHIVYDEADLLILVVRKSQQKRGIGKRLLVEFLNEAKRRNVKKVFLEVSEKNIPAISLYKKFGFKPYGKRDNYYRIGKNAILMRLILNGTDFDAD